MNIYNYIKDTKEFTSITVACKNPLEEGKYLVPSDATTLKVIEPKDGFAVCFNTEHDKWEYVEDNRGKTAYKTNTKKSSTIDYLGKIEDGFTLIVPTDFDEWNDIDKCWNENVVAKESFRISLINLKSSEIIENKYPIYRQINITNLLTPYTALDKDEMCMFIDTVRGIARDAKTNGTLYNDINWAGLDGNIS